MIDIQDALDLVRAYRRYVEHLQGRHNQKSHGNKYGSTSAIKGNVARLGGDKNALKSMAQKARADKDFQFQVKSSALDKQAERKIKKIRQNLVPQETKLPSNVNWGGVTGNTALNQNNFERLKDKVQQGIITVDEANVQKVLGERVSIVKKLPSHVRKSLNKAVKDKVLGHKKKDGYMPEVYYHPDFEHLANSAREEAARKTISALGKVYGIRNINDDFPE